uniref:Putative ovule protein n=1 Tax=Solanum chacoense TaxID=4108 RepID=A0A0V0GHN4_SOLCH
MEKLAFRIKLFYFLPPSICWQKITCKCRNMGANTKCREPLDDYTNFHLFGESSNFDLPVNRASTIIINCNMHTDKSNNYIEQI